MWLNVQFFDAAEQLIAERGAYDPVTATPADDAVHYELTLGFDAAVASAVGLTPGPSHHVAFCNVIYKDTRIPPRGFTNEAFRQIQSPVIGAGYSDGEYWDDELYPLPRDAVEARVALYYKTASTEFITFLRDANHTDDTGQILYDEWEKSGKSPPVEMVSQTIALGAFGIGDLNGDTVIALDDYLDFADCLDGPDTGPIDPDCWEADMDGDDDVDLRDAARYQGRFGTTE